MNTIDDFREFFKPNKSRRRVTYGELIESVLSIVEVSLKNKNTKLIKNLNSERGIYSYPK